MSELLVGKIQAGLGDASRWLKLFNANRCRQPLATGLKAEMKIDRATAFLGLFLFLFATRAITVAMGGFDEA
jgi:hypothetical protein